MAYNPVYFLHGLPGSRTGHHVLFIVEAAVSEDGWVILAPGIRVRREQLVITATHGGGPGGQHVNTTDSQVVLHLRLADLVGLAPDQRQRLCCLLGRRLCHDDIIVLRCAQDRSQQRNRQLVVERLAALVREAAQRPRRRRATRPTRASVERRLDGKARASRRKQDRRPPDREE